MIVALFYLQWHSIRNRLVTRFKRLRQPKYLMGAVVGGIYMYLYFFRFIFMSRHGDGQTAGFLATPENQSLIELGGALLLFVIVLLAWIFPSDRAALQFTEAEVAFLFPAPVSRRQLIHYKLLRSQLAIFISAFFLSLVSRRFGGNALCHALGWWLILSTLNLHFIASSFARTMLLDSGLSNLWRRVLTLGVVAGLVALVWHWVSDSLPPMSGDDDAADGSAMLKYAEQVLTTGPALYLLYPFRLVVRPFLAPDGTAFLVALAPAVLIGGLHYLWVVYSSVAFEEASVAASQKTAVRVAAMRSGNWQSLNKRKKAGRPWFQLAPTGPAPFALMWKNLLGLAQVFNVRVLISLSIVMVAFASVFANSHEKKAESIVAAVVIGIALAYSLLLGPQILRLDFRADLPMADILKTYPLPGWKIALGEILAPVVVMAAFQWLLLLLGVFLVFFLPLKPAGFFLAIGFGCALILPPLDAVLLIIQNLAAVLFPAWVPSGKDSPRGVEVMGQRIILGLAQLLVMVLSLVPAAAAFVAVFWPLEIFLSPVLAIPPAALVAAVVVAGEAALGVMLLGKAFDRFDVTEVSAT